MPDITIPPAALEAGAREMYLRSNPDLKWEDCAIECGQDVRQVYLYRARAAFVAMVAAWPGMQRRIHIEQAIILPLMENPDAEA